MNKPILAILVLCCLSCATINEEKLYSRPAQSTQANVLIETFKIKKGMTPQEVSMILGSELTIGYKVNKSTSKLEPITIAQPYREETISKEGNRYVIHYYFASIVKADGLISEEELMPLVYLENKLIAKGKNELNLLRLR